MTRIQTLTTTLTLLLSLAGGACALLPFDETGSTEAAVETETADEPLHLRCNEAFEPKNSICVADGITFFSADLRYSECAKSEGSMHCLAMASTSPGVPLELFSGGQQGSTMDCPEGSTLTCEYQGEDVVCWCEPDSGGGGGGGDPGFVLYLKYELASVTADLVDDVRRADSAEMRCDGAEDGASRCSVGGVEFLSSDLAYSDCDQTRDDTLECVALSSHSPNVPADLWSGQTQSAEMDCPEGTTLTCTYIGEDVHCWCEKEGGSGGSGGGSFNFIQVGTKRVIVDLHRDVLR